MAGHREHDLTARREPNPSEHSRGPPRRQARQIVTRSTSSIVVSPPATLVHPSYRSDVIP